jgi:hypothetical protein
LSSTAHKILGVPLDPVPRGWRKEKRDVVIKRRNRRKNNKEFRETKQGIIEGNKSRRATNKIGTPGQEM